MAAAIVVARIHHAASRHRGHAGPSRNIARPSRPAHTRCSSSTRPGGTPPASSISPPTSPSCPCRRLAPELNLAENIWKYLRQNYLGNRVFADYTAILDACQDAWRKLLAGAGRITSIAQRQWAIIGQSL
jgi:hypothetical protein